jgi:hypothetical protein
MYDQAAKVAAADAEVCYSRRAPGTLGQKSQLIDGPEIPTLISELGELLKRGEAVLARAEGRLQSVMRSPNAEVDPQHAGYGARTQAGDALCGHIMRLRLQYDALERLLDRVEL